MYGGIYDPGMGLCRPRVALASFSSPSRSAMGRPGWGFHAETFHIFFRWLNILVALFLCRSHPDCKNCDMITTICFHILYIFRNGGTHSLGISVKLLSAYEILLQCIDVSKPRVSCTCQPWNKYEIYTASEVVPRVCYIQLVVYFHYLLLYPIVVQQSHAGSPDTPCKKHCFSVMCHNST